MFIDLEYFLMFKYIKNTLSDIGEHEIYKNVPLILITALRIMYNCNLSILISNTVLFSYYMTAENMNKLGTLIEPCIL